jgi:hypothetical protein
MSKRRILKEKVTKIPSWLVGLVVAVGLFFIISRPHQIASSHVMEGAAQTNAHYGRTFR